jgi:calcineurin-like phosphoesterase family protein
MNGVAISDKIYVTPKRYGNIFVTSDQHYDHEVIRVHCNRPFADLVEMNEAMIENHNNLVKPTDTVIMLGDLAWKRHTYFINALNGKKILVIGNHDCMTKVALDQFTDVIGTPKRPGIYQRNIDGQYCVFCHFPMWSWNASFHGSWHFYGHCHGRKREIEHREDGNLGVDESAPPPRLQEFVDGLSCSVDVDAWDYTPVPWEVLKAKMESREESWNERKESWRLEHANKSIKSSQKDYPEILAAENHKWRQRVVFKPVA